MCNLTTLIYLILSGLSPLKEEGHDGYECAIKIRHEILYAISLFLEYFLCGASYASHFFNASVPVD